jgi:hypothetical protein
MNLCDGFCAVSRPSGLITESAASVIRRFLAIENGRCDTGLPCPSFSDTISALTWPYIETGILAPDKRSSGILSKSWSLNYVVNIRFNLQA